MLQAGKALNDKKAEVRIQFHHVPGVVSALSECAGNELVVRLQPEESIYWKVQNKVPGLHFEVQQMRMDLLYSSKFFQKKLPEAYERLLLEVLRRSELTLALNLALVLTSSGRLNSPSPSP